MQFIKRILFFTTILIASIVTNAQQQKQPTPTKGKKLITITQSNQNEDEFTRLIRLNKAKATASKIIIHPKSSDIETREFNTVDGKPVKPGRTVLSIPVEIVNSSNRVISMKLRHEWYGGIAIYSDLMIAVQKPDNENSKLRTLWWEGTGYQVGNVSEVKKPTILEPGEKIKIDVRLNWYGTGSEPHEPLIDETQPPQEYLIKFLLFFETNNSKEYLLTHAYKIKLKTLKQ